MQIIKPLLLIFFRFLCSPPQNSTVYRTIILGASEVSANLYFNSCTSVLGRLRDYLRLLMGVRRNNIDSYLYCLWVHVRYSRFLFPGKKMVWALSIIQCHGKVIQNSRGRTVHIFWFVLLEQHSILFCLQWEACEISIL